MRAYPFPSQTITESPSAGFSLNWPIVTPPARSTTARQHQRPSQLLPRPVATSGGFPVERPYAAPAGVPMARLVRETPTLPAVYVVRSPPPAASPAHDRRTCCTSRPALAPPSAGLSTTGGGPSLGNTEHRPAFRTGRCPRAPPSGLYDPTPGAGDNLALPSHTPGHVPAHQWHTAGFDTARRIWNGPFGLSGNRRLVPLPLSPETDYQYMPGDFDAR